MVLWNNAARPTTFVSATQITAQITSTDVATAGTPPVVVQNSTSSSAASTFTIDNPSPTATSLSPSTALVGSGAVTVTVSGSNFVSGSVINWNGVAQQTTFVSSTQVTAALPAANFAATGTDNISVTNPAPGGGSSTNLPFTVANPVPVLSSLSPSTSTAGSAAIVLDANGSGFNASSQILWNGSARSTTFVSSTQLTATISATDLALSGTASVSVLTAAPGGGTSAALPFSIDNPLPVLLSISPSTVVAAGPAFTLAVTGSGFTSASTVKVNGSARSTTFISSTSLSAAITAADIAKEGSAGITVTTPSPGGGTSSMVTLSIQQTANPVPTLTSLTPSTVNAGAAAFTLTVSGGDFVQGATVLWNGSARATTFNSSSSLSSSITAADVATAGTVQVSVSNPAPGGGTSGSLPFVIAVPPSPKPSIASLSPPSASAASGAFNLTIQGSGFVANSQALWNGSARTTAYVSSSQLTAAITAADIATQGTANVTVSNPAPGGGLSNTAVFTITTQVNPTPVITTLTPASTPITTSALTIAIAGSGFLPNSVVYINGYDPGGTTTYESATLLQFTIPAYDLSTVQTLQVSVFNSSPGGGQSNALPFNVTAPTNSTFTMLTVNVTANDIAWDAAHTTFYASTPSTGAPSGNSIIPISTNGTIGTAVYAGSEPTTLAISGDDTKLYTMLTGSDTVERFDLPSLSTDISIGIQQAPASYWGPYKPLGIAVAPGAPRTVAVLRGDPVFEDGGAIIFDDATPRPNQEPASGYSYEALQDSIVWGKDATQLYEAAQVFDYLTVMTVNSTGISNTTNYVSTYNSYGEGIHFDKGTGYVYDDQGHVTDPSTGLPVGIYSASGVMTTDSTLGIAYFIGSTNVIGSTYTLEAFDLTHFTPIATTTLYGISGVPSRLIRFGTNGLAFVTGGASEYSVGSSQVYIITGYFVTKPSALANPFEGGVKKPQALWKLPPVATRPLPIATPAIP